MKKHRARNSGSFFLRHLLLLTFLVITAYPLLWMVLAAFRLEGDAQMRPLALPAPWTWQNFAQVCKNASFGDAYLNSLMLCSGSVLLSIALAAPAAFAFAQCRFRGRHTLFMLFLLGMMIPVHVTLIPLNRLLGSGALNLKGSLWALVGPYVGFALPITMLILRGAFAALPRDLLDAGRIDGCSTWGIFRHIAMPIARPALATVVIFNFLTMWNEFAFALTLLGPGQTTIPLALSQFKGEHDVQITLVSAALSLVVIPLLIVYVFAQKHIIRGLTAGAVKE